MNVLVTAASKHGATTGIAEAIVLQLQETGLDAEFRTPDAVPSLSGYDAVVLGSGVYAGHWMAPAKGFVNTYESTLRSMPVWLFSCGPLGDPPKPVPDPVEVAAIVERIGARGHRVFAGRLDSSDLGLAERAILKVVRAPQGDFRPWQEVRDWATLIAETMRALVATPA